MKWLSNSLARHLIIGVAFVLVVASIAVLAYMHNGWSFADALYWVRHGDLSRPLPPLRLVPERPGRLEPRAIKRRRHKYPLMTTSRKNLRHALRRKKP